MIRAIVAIDEDRGLANEHGIPWQGSIPSDARYFTDKTNNSNILMGYKTYLEFARPLTNRQNFVLTRSNESLRSGFIAVHSEALFMEQHPNAWIIGGAGLFERTLENIEQLYITQLRGTYGCTRFFPEYEHTFDLVSESDVITENAISYTFQMWQPKNISQN